MENQPTITKYNLVEKFSTKHAKIYTVKELPHIGIIQTKSNYIPIKNFQEIFNIMGDIVKQDRITKLVFDKQSLTIFHQPSMEWYYTLWKEDMYHLGLKTYRKILPNDQAFRQSVKIGRDKIEKQFPDLKYATLDMCYVDSIDEAIDN